MTTLQKNDTTVYEESENISSAIEKIEAENISCTKKLHKLKLLKQSAVAPLSQSHVDYYIDKIKEKQNRFVSRMILFSLSLLYFLFTLCRVYWYCNPQRNPLSASAYTINDVIVIIYIIVGIFIGSFAIRSILINKRKQ